MPFTHILFPVDFSERCRAVIPHVRAMCERFHTTLTLAHFIEIPVPTYGAVDVPFIFDMQIDEMTASAMKELSSIATTCFPDIKVTATVEAGDPGACIADFARGSGVNLIMLPTRGRGRFRAALLGSVAAKTLHDTHCAVWTEAHCEEAGSRHTAWRNILCAIDTEAEGLRLIRYGAELAAASGAVVRLVHALPVPKSGPERYMDLEFAAALEARARAAIAEMQAEAGTACEVSIVAGDIPEVVRQAAKTHDADLVLIGRGALPHFAGRLRSFMLTRLFAICHVQ